METWLVFFAALFCGLLAYIGVIKQSKATSVSNFRVNWINDLRDNYSRFLISLTNADSKFREKQSNTNEYSKDEEADNANFLKTKIKLMLNHNENEHIIFWEAFTKYMQSHKEHYRGEYSKEKEIELDKLRVQMEQLLLTIFKKEWKKVKKLG